MFLLFLGVDERQLHDGKRLQESLQKQINELTNCDLSAQIKELTRRRDDTIDDLKKLNESRMSYQAKLKSRLDKIISQEESLHAKSEKGKALAMFNSELRETCKERNMDPENQTVQVVIETLRTQVAEKKEEIDVSDKNKWELEMKGTKLIAEVEKAALSFNRTLVEIEVKDFDSETKSGFRLDAHTNISEAAQFLNLLGSDIKAEERETSGTLATLTKEATVLSNDVESVDRMTQKLRHELQQICEECKRTNAKIDSESDIAVKTLGDLKASLVKEQERHHKNPIFLEKHFNQIKKEKENVKLWLQQVVENGKLAFETTLKALERKRELQLQLVEKLMREHQKLCNSKCETVEEETNHLRKIVDHMKKAST